MTEVPKSAHEKTGGMMYFPRMLDKIRLHQAGRLRADFIENLGRRADGWCTSFLRISYDDLKLRVREGGSDEAILQWCFSHGRILNEVDLMVWNSFMSKLGWNDFYTARLQQGKVASGFADRSDIVTMVDYFDVDEGRPLQTGR
jgi:gluconokinase